MPSRNPFSRYLNRVIFDQTRLKHCDSRLLFNCNNCYTRTGRSLIAIRKARDPHFKPGATEHDPEAPDSKTGRQGSHRK
ncbi:hypothetical protein Thi970DRAFT_01210 [Thiorhodovibrio frisius]|uniref:Uncharacterized protein n=1 Tax=Thiorhodovibrio frisius TaxID=631362 RepID=H8YYL3_9GAMM|nr:hypothetical protein Thi970DRAFT_01210 [Thiorhodovibrio frisius]WPL23374.1 hypothetical protein Thiofri_03559 [Thiorhodovibrio frisius]